MMKLLVKRSTIHDWDKLQRVAEFNPEYLHLETKPVVGESR
jgi:hypothetical protein